MVADPKPLSTAKRRPTPLRLLYVGIALVVLLLIASNAAVILYLRESDLLQQEDRLKNLSLILAEQANRSFEAVDLVASRLAEMVATEGVNNGASFDQKMAGHDVHLLLRERMTGLPVLDAITVISRDGKLLNLSRAWPVPAVDVSDRDYFQAMKEDPSVKTYIGQPVPNRVTGSWVILFARRVSGADGELLGIILGAIKMQYFEDFYRAISLREGSTAALIRLDGLTLIRFPRSDTVGQKFFGADHLLRGGVSATLRELSPVDGQMRIKAAHRVANYPVLTIATITEAAALANWRGIAALMSLAALGCALSIVVAGFAFGRHWKQQATLADSEAELRRQEDHAAAMGTAASVAQATAVQMTHSAEHDFLTGLPNRMLLNDRIGQAIALAQRNSKAVAVLFLDLDGFKHINDSLGHGVGDKLLQSIAVRLMACVRGSDTVSRQGGDEFVVLLSEMARAEDASIAASRIVQAVTGPHSIDQHELHVHAATTAGRMLQAVAEPYSIDHHDLHVTASIGVSVYPADGLDAETLIKNADTAMYQAKENGRQNYRFFEPAMNVRAVERQFIEEGLRRALERREFILHYQPVVDLATGAITGAEALIRWMHPARGLIPPLQFIPVAEECGLIVPIGAWMLREACWQARAWVDAGLPAAMNMAVNLSAIELRNENFLVNLFAILNETGLEPTSLVVEVTEGVLMKNPEAKAAVLRTLRESGVQVALDDFGTGYSSLGYLRKFPLDILKIDQSFVRQIGILGESAAIVIAVIAMARSLDIRVIAEGVETLEELEFLRSHHCDAAQGYYFSRPVAPEQFAKLLRAWRTRTARPLVSVDPD